MKQKPVIIVLCFNCLVCVSCTVNPDASSCVAYESKYHVDKACECVVYQSDGGSQGTFTSPNFPQIYPSNIQCILYTFIGAHDEIIKLSFYEFDLQVPITKCTDYVRFYLDLERPEVNEKDRYNYELCGNISRIQKVHYSSDRTLIFEFHTDSIQGNHTGFRGRFNFLNRTEFETVGCKSRWGATCAYDCTKSNSDFNKKQIGIFFSPEYPQNYPPDKNCQYRFRAGEDERIKIIFKKIELDSTQRSCSDAITVHDGDDANKSIMIAEYCSSKNLTGNTTGEQVISSGNHLIVQFKTDENKQSQGFAATFEFIPDKSVPPRPVTTTPRTITYHPPPSPKDDPKSRTASTKCDGAVIRSDIHKSGVITSPGYPHTYKENIVCHYLFRGSGQERVQFEFTVLDLFYVGNANDPFDCDASDSIEIQVPIDSDEKTLGVYCGKKTPPLLMSPGTDLDVIFSTLSRVIGPSTGFNATYKFVTDFGIHKGQQIHHPNMPCAFKFNSSISPNGTFASPNYPGLYPKNTECHYLFYGHGSQKVHITFPYFDVEGILPACSEQDTESDYLEFSNFDVPLPDRKMLRFCGRMQDLPEKEVVSDRNFFRVSFKSNFIYDATGFEAFYQFRNSGNDPKLPTPGGQASSQDSPIFSTMLILLVICFNLFS